MYLLQIVLVVVAVVMSALPRERERDNVAEGISDEKIQEVFLRSHGGPRCLSTQLGLVNQRKGGGAGDGVPCRKS